MLKLQQEMEQAAKAGKYEEALPYFREALQRKRRVLGNEHRSTVISINNMGDLLITLSRHDEAAELQAGLTALRKVLQANPMIPTLKAIVAKRRDDPAWLRLRPPLVALARPQSDQLWNGLAAAGFAVGGA